ncbi:MAG: glycosyltransferase family 39 protein [Pseudomonadota bacterium]
MALLLAAAGSLLTFTNLGGKVYWHDETYSSLRVFGHTGAEYYDSMFDGAIHTPAELQRLQHIDESLGLEATFRALASRPEHPPLYYLLARLWSVLFTDPVIALRSLAAVFALLMLPAAYAFSRELFVDPRVAWVAVALLAVSPLHLLYAQEARQYSLWCLAILLSGTALLRALRSGRRLDLLLYACAIALGLYAHILFAVAVFAHAAYLALQRRAYARQALQGCALALAGGVLAFLPWALLFLTALPDVARVIGWMERPLAISALMLSWATSINRVFFDFPGSIVLAPVSLGLVTAALVLLVRRTPPQHWLLPALLLAVTAGVVIVPDLLDEGRRSLHTRYLLPALLMLQLGVAWLIGCNLVLRTRRGMLAAAAALLLVGGGLASQLAIVASNQWWNKGFSAGNADIAARINAAERPLLISTMGEVNPGELLSLSYYLKDQARLLLLHDYKLPELPAGFDRYFVLRAIWDTAQAQQRGYRLERLTRDRVLWELHHDESHR